MIVVYTGKQAYKDAQGRFVLKTNDKLEVEETEGNELLKAKNFRKDRGVKK